MTADYKNLTDTELFLLFKQDDLHAFDEMYDRHFIPLLNAAFKRLQSRDEALEIVQDLFVQLYFKRKQLAPTYNMGGYLQMMLRNKVIDRFREQLVRKKHIYRFQEQKPGSTFDAPEEYMDVKLLEQKIYAVIEQLPDKCREVFLLSRFHNLSHQAIAEKLNISVSTVEKHIVKALKIVRKHIDHFQVNALLLTWYLAAS